MVVKNGDDLISAVSNTPKENVVPIFCVSSVSGSGLDDVKKFLQLLPPSAGLKEQEKLEQAHPEFQIGTVCGPKIDICPKNMLLIKNLQFSPN